jgi:hypothetical protein
MVIVEGPDGSGKTTLVTQLLARFADLERAPRPDLIGTRSEGAYEETLAAVVEAAAMVMPPKVYDRLFLSELIYGDVLRGGSNLTRIQILYTLSLLDAVGCPLIVCLPPLPVVTTNVLESEQLGGVQENIHRLWQLYSIANQAFPNVIHYDYTVAGSRGRIFSQVSAYLTLRERRAP